MTSSHSPLSARVSRFARRAVAKFPSSLPAAGVFALILAYAATVRPTDQAFAGTLGTVIPEPPPRSFAPEELEDLLSKEEFAGVRHQLTAFIDATRGIASIDDVTLQALPDFIALENAMEELTVDQRAQLDAWLATAGSADEIDSLAEIGPRALATAAPWTPVLAFVATSLRAVHATHALNRAFQATVRAQRALNAAARAVRMAVQATDEALAAVTRVNRRAAREALRKANENMKAAFYAKTAELMGLAALATYEFEAEYKEWRAKAMKQHCEDIANPDCVDFENFLDDDQMLGSQEITTADLERMRLLMDLDGAGR